MTPCASSGLTKTKVFWVASHIKAGTTQGRRINKVKEQDMKTASAVIRSAAAFFISALLLSTGLAAAAENTKKVFPFGIGTTGGLGGQVIRVTNLEKEGPGSLREALDTKGPRIIVFEVGGVINLGWSGIAVREPFLTIAGQTAPSPGITLIKGGIVIRTHDVIFRHCIIAEGLLHATHPKGAHSRVVPWSWTGVRESPFSETFLPTTISVTPYLGPAEKTIT